MKRFILFSFVLGLIMTIGKLVLDIKELKIRVADRDIRIKQLRAWLVEVNMGRV